MDRWSSLILAVSVRSSAVKCHIAACCDSSFDEMDNVEVRTTRLICDRHS